MSPGEYRSEPISRSDNNGTEEAACARKPFGAVRLALAALLSGPAQGFLRAPSASGSRDNVAARPPSRFQKGLPLGSPSPSALSASPGLPVSSAERRLRQSLSLSRPGETVEAVSV